LGATPEDLHVPRVSTAEHFKMTAPEFAFASQVIVGLSTPRLVMRR